MTRVQLLGCTYEEDFIGRDKSNLVISIPGGLVSWFSTMSILVYMNEVVNPTIHFKKTIS